MFCFLLQKQKKNTKGERENRERDLREFLQEKKLDAICERSHPYIEK
jgi:precorrin-6x reductase